MGCPLLLEVSVFSFLLTVLDFLVIVLKVSFVLHLSFLVHVLLSSNFFCLYWWQSKRRNSLKWSNSLRKLRWRKDGGCKLRRQLGNLRCVLCFLGIYYKCFYQFCEHCKEFRFVWSLFYSSLSPVSPMIGYNNWKSKYICSGSYRLKQLEKYWAKIPVGRSGRINWSSGKRN